MHQYVDINQLWKLSESFELEQKQLENTSKHSLNQMTTEVNSIHMVSPHYEGLCTVTQLLQDLTYTVTDRREIKCNFSDESFQNKRVITKHELPQDENCSKKLFKTPKKLKVKIKMAKEVNQLLSFSQLSFS